MTIRHLLLTAAACAAIAIPNAAAAQMRALSDPVVPHPDPESLFTSEDPLLHRNKQAALHIQRDLLKCNKWSEAGTWLTDRYIQHNPVAASGLEGVIYFFTEVAKREPLDPCPALSAEDPNGVVAVQAEGDYVTILTRRIVPYADNPEETYTTTWFDTWRFVEGKADEHWDPATLPAAAPAQSAAPASAEQRLADRAAIEDLMWRYVRAADTLDADAYAAVFTPDGAFNTVQGHDALKRMIGRLQDGNAGRYARGEVEGAGMFHTMSNQRIEFVEPDHARVHYYWQTLFGGGSQVEGAPRVAAVGRGMDDVVKVGGRWLIRKRNVMPDEG